MFDYQQLLFYKYLHNTLGMLVRLGHYLLHQSKFRYGFFMSMKFKSSKADNRMVNKLKNAQFLNKLEPNNIERNINQNIGIQKEAENNQNNTLQYPKNKKPSKQKYVQNSQVDNKNLIIRQSMQKFDLQTNELSQFENALKTLGKALQPLNPKLLRQLNLNQAAHRQNKEIHYAIQSMKQLQLKDFSVLVHRLLVNSVNTNSTNQKYIWKQIQENFLQRFQVTTDPNSIRSYSKLIYCLAKSKIHRETSSALISTSASTNLQNFETKFALLLPSASHQSFTTIITSLSRMGPLSEQFSYIAQRLYYSKYNELNVRQKVQINYALTRNGKKVDKNLINLIQNLNLKQILIMLRCYQNSSDLTHEILTLSERHIVLRKQEMNVIDIGDICNIYFSAIVQGYKLSNELEKVLTQMYKILRKNMNQVTFEKIWKNLAQVINRGYLQVQFMEQIIKTIKYFQKKQIFPERIWKPMRKGFQNFQNLQIRQRLQQIK